MAGRKGPSEERTRQAGARAGRHTDGDPRGTIGWGVEADPEEDMFFRRVLFFVSVVAVVCVCGWFLATTVHSSAGRSPALNANGRAPAATAVYTVRLLEEDIAASARNELMKMASLPRLKQLAEPHGFEYVQLPNGKLAFCVGCFEDENSPELRALLSKVREFTDDGQMVFGYASVFRYTK